MRFSYIDIFLILGLGVGGFLGYRGGLAKKLFNLLMLLLAVIVASRLMGPVGDFFSESGVLSETASYVLGFALVLLAVMVPAVLLYRRFGRSRGAQTAGNTIGAVLGVIEGAMLISFVLMGLRVFDIPEEDDRQESLLYRPLVRFVPKTFDLLQSYFPGASAFKEQVTTKFKQFDFFGPTSQPIKKP